MQSKSPQFLRIPLALVLGAAVACGSPSSPPGDTPDAGDVTDTPDAGGITDTPDAGEHDTPDAGHTGTPTFKLRAFNVTQYTGGAGDLSTAPPTMYLQGVASMSLTDYVDVPVGTRSLAFAQGASATVDTSGYVAGDRVTVAVALVGATPYALALKEAVNEDASLRVFQVMNGYRAAEVLTGAGVSVPVAQNATARLDVPVSVKDMTLGGVYWLHFTPSRIPAGGSGILVQHDGDWFLLGAPGTQTALLPDREIRAVNLAFTLGDGATFKAQTVAGEFVIASNLNRNANASTSTFVPQPITGLSAGGGTQGGSGTYTPAANELSETSELLTVVATGTSTAKFHLVAPPEVTGVNSLTVWGAVENLRFRATQMNNSMPGTWYPDWGPGYVEPFGVVGLTYTGSSPRIGFGVSNPPSAPMGLPEPVYQLSNMSDRYDAFLHLDGTSTMKLATLKPDGTVQIYAP